MSQPRPLTHDEKKAAEAAFQGRPFDASWSKSARGVYEGILKARGDVVDADSIETTPASPTPTRHVTSRQDAIDAGLLVDVTQKAQRIGLNLAVGITKSLWDRSITQAVELDPHEWDLRVRDMLLAVRLRLAGLETPMPWIEVPVLFPADHGEASPRMFPIYALFHKDPVAEDCLTLIHPNEWSSMRLSSRSDEEEGLPSTDTV